MLLVTIGAVLAVIGGIMFIYVMVATLLVGKDSDRPSALVLAFGPQAVGPRVARRRPWRPTGTRVWRASTTRTAARSASQLRGAGHGRARVHLPRLVRAHVHARALQHEPRVAGGLRWLPVS
jgi:hypothetical protein